MSVSYTKGVCRIFGSSLTSPKHMHMIYPDILQCSGVLAITAYSDGGTSYVGDTRVIYDPNAKFENAPK